MRYVGPEIPTLNEGWTFMGADLNEWFAGAGVGMVYLIFMQQFVKRVSGQDGVVLLILIVGTTYLLRILREKFPDGRRGLANKACDMMGFPPPLIPKPSSFCSYWSGAPVQDISRTEFARLKFHEFLLAKTWHKQTQEQ